MSGIGLDSFDRGAAVGVQTLKELQAVWWGHSYDFWEAGIGLDRFERETAVVLSTLEKVQPSSAAVVG